MKKTIVSLFLAFVMALSLFSFVACRGGNSDFNNPGDDYDANIDMTDDDYNQQATLTVGVTADPYESELIKAVAEGFKNIFPNVKIETVRISGNDYVSEVDKRFNAGSMPDLIYTSESESFSFISSEYFLNLEPYIRLETERNAEFEAQFVQEAWKMGQENYNGSQYFLPRSSDRVVTHLNKKYTVPAIAAWNENHPEEKLPEDIIKNGWTWDDFLKVCAALREYYDSQGWTISKGYYLVDHTFTWAPIMFSLFKSNGASIADGTTFTFDNEGTVKTAEMIRNMIEKGYIGHSSTGGANYENGNGAMLFHSSSAIAKYKNYIKENYDIVTFPLINGTSGVFGFGVPGYGIYAGIDESKRDLAWQFLSYIVSYEGQEYLAKAGMNTPSVRMDLQDYETASWGEGFRDLNLEATVWQPERNYSETFFLNFPASKKQILVNTLSSFINEIMTYEGTAIGSMKPSYTIDSCIDECLKDLNKYISK